MRRLKGSLLAVLLLAACGTSNTDVKDLESDSEKSFNKHLRTAYDAIENKDFDTAISELTRCVDDSRGDTDKRHLLLALHTLAEAELKKGDLKSAEAHCREGIEIGKHEYASPSVHSFKKDYGVDLGKTEHLLAKVLTAQNRLEEAVTTYREAMHIEDVEIGPQYLREEMLKECSALLQRMGKGDEAEVTEQNKVDLGINIAEQAGMAKRMATEHNEELAEKLYLQTVDIAEKNGSYDDRRAIESANWLIARDVETNRYDDADKLVDKLDGWFKKSKRENSFQSVKNEFSRGLILSKRKKFKEAIPVLKQTLARAQALRPQNDGSISFCASIINQTGNAYMGDKQYKEAKQAYVESLAYVKRCREPNARLLDYLTRRIQHMDKFVQ